jgi:hypothetical protein
MEFLGRLNDPYDFELTLMGQRLADTDDRLRALISIRGREIYFREFSVTHFPTIMRGPASAQWPIIGVLTDAWSFDRDMCLTLVEQNWLPDPAKDGLARRVISGLTEWDERATNIVRTLIRRTDDEGERLFWAEQLVYAIAESQPAMAPDIFVETMRRIEINDRTTG